jgi:hypothetical protein
MTLIKLCVPRNDIRHIPHTGSSPTPEVPTRRVSALFLSVLLLACAGSKTTSEPGPADLPGTVARVGAMADETIHVQSVALPDFAVIDHAIGMSNAVEMIRGGNWDYVVLQQGPTTTSIGRDTLVLAVRQLDPSIRAPGARAALLMVWPPSGNLDRFDAVRQSYQEAAEAVHGLFLPAGEAWRAAWAVDPELPLYGADGFHPSELGTYLAALVVYEGITGHDARALPAAAAVAAHPLAIPATKIRLLQRVAHETVARFP